jgi:hypothetical protein
MDDHILVFGSCVSFDSYRRRMIEDDDFKALHHVRSCSSAQGWRPSNILLLYGWDFGHRQETCDVIFGLLSGGSRILGDYSEIGWSLWEVFKNFEKRVEKEQSKKIEPYNRRPVVDRFQLIDFEE